MGPMIRLYATTIPLSRSDDPAARKETTKLLHSAAWSLLAVSLHRLYPDLFPGSTAESLPAVSKGEHGKPAFADTSLPGFSLSHSGRAAVCALSDRGPVGVDVQEHREIRGVSDIDGIAARFFHPLEQELLSSEKDPAMRRRLFFTIFSCKEACVKMTGQGMSEDFREFYTVFDENGRPNRILDGKTGRIIGCPVLIDLQMQDAYGAYTLVSCSQEPAGVSGPEQIRVM